MRNSNWATVYKLNKMQGLEWPSGLPKYLAKSRTICHFFIPKDLLSISYVLNLILGAGDRTVNKITHKHLEVEETVLELRDQALSHLSEIKFSLTPELSSQPHRFET